MEPRTYIPNNRLNSDPGIITRMQRDLSSSPHQSDSPGAESDSSMLRRAAGKSPHVCIVGAGVAGLRCADVLLQHGAKVTMIEGRDRIGGRLCQGKVHGNLVDLGPNWIHGTDSNPILDLAKETGTLTMSWDGRQAVFDYLGNAMPEKDAEENTEIVWTIIEQAMKYSNDNCADIPAERSLYDFFIEKLEQLFPSQIEDDKVARQRRETVLRMAEMWGAFVGSPIQTQSLRYFWLEECIDGENVFVAETYHKILRRIAKPVLDQVRVDFKRKVTKISSNLNDEDPSVTIETESGQGETFDEVVMTAPLGWLKRNNDAFTPELPNRLKQAIDAIGYGHLDKVYITFPTAFWNQPSDAANIVSMPHQTSSANVTATTAPLNQPAKPTLPPTHYPGFTHWTSPRYTTSTNPNHWNQECVNLAALPSPCAHPTLLFYTFGPTSLHLAFLLKQFPSPSDVKAQALLTEFFKPYFSRLPNYSASNPEHQPASILATLWANDELAGYGSYANFQIGLERGDEDVEVMRKGLPERGVWLAGEHTAPFVALGTVTGAYWAGEGVAKRIAKAYGLERVGGESG
ncbi:amine oxidase [Westerdykella ornata]|uniref:Amine oxidase n=1 Tax=Westerdykella ornata TaxID=318751 RepID=A0A6A6JQA6_WESOR|nr:amine oxidase [Westerdykella ornata]KAF2278722.1 amine oxidase [Westerdykella ornata]